MKNIKIDGNSKLILPYPPSDNTYYTIVNGRKVLSKKGRDFKIEVIFACLKQNAKKFGNKRIGIKVVTHAKDKRTRDINNLWKSLCDALTCSKVWDDDEQIDKAYIERGEIDKDKIGYIEVYIDIVESI